MSRMPYLSLQGVTKVYPGSVAAVSNLNLDVERNELVVLFGPSGCGKTTTLRLIAGLESPTKGEIFLGGRNLHQIAPWQRDVAFVFQHPVLMPQQTVRQALADARSAAALRDIAEHFELNGLMDSQGVDLSGGEKQRVALARAWLRQPSALLLDEPLAHLDVPAKRRLWQELDLLRRRSPATIIYVTHDPVEAMALADRIAVLLDGAVKQIDLPDRLRSHPVHRFIAEVFQDPSDPLNFLNLRPDETRALGIHPGLEESTTKIAAVPASQIFLEKGDHRGEAWRVAAKRKGLDCELLVCERGAVRVTARVNPLDDFQPGQPVMIKRIGQTSHWFDAITGLREEAG